MDEFCESINNGADASFGIVTDIHFEDAKLENIPQVTDFIEEQLNNLDCPMKTVIQVNIVIDEIYSNIVKYGYKDTSGPVTVTFAASEDKKTVWVTFVDKGVEYNPLMKEDPDITLAAEERSIGGLGIFMVKKTMDSLDYKYENGQNVLTVKKTIQ